ncbi:sodium- and chloride-dependent glycine transporter 1-like [Lingula anatina]|uniref:Transporter n=1 Tax=Lingula anatina TaxID=7574 RepID=A0A2R2MM77_LINAN|nr:sodium- and chloride-dependent glycine transporter 1-like [Lingula anatina]|eukprot:XP_023931328.1 sodium- and chloride-dependent glycine transporter 1-like [Lingula anatina]
MGRSDSLVDSVEEKKRRTWGGQLEFIISCAAVGLGAVWRFPYLCYRNGGGAFLIPYCVSWALIILPLYFMELCFGQFASLGPIAVWKINPLFKGIGYGMVVTCWFLTLYYSVLIGYCIHYFFASMTAILPWSTCGNAWNTEDCLVVGGGTPTDATNLTIRTTLLNTTDNTEITVTSPSEEYFYRKVLEMTDGIENSGGLKWDLVLCHLLAWVIVSLVLIKGVKSMGKAIYFTAIFPHIIMAVLLVRGALLEGSAEGIKYYLTPDFKRLLHSEVWGDAVTHNFYSLSISLGGLVMMSSHNKFHHNCFRDAFVCSLVNCGTNVYAGFVIFSVLGYMAHISGKEVAEVASQGPGLAFIVYPEAISQLPLPTLWAILFFFMMALLGFSVQFAMVETVLGSIMDEYAHILRSQKWREIMARAVGCGVCFLLGLPMCARGGHYLLDLMDHSVGGFPLLFISLLELIVLQWVYGWSRFSEDVKIMLGKKPGIYFRIMWRYITPLLLLAVIVFKFVQLQTHNHEVNPLPVWAQVLGWMIQLIPIALIPALFLGRYCYDGGFKALKKAGSPQADWGPARAKNRAGTIYDTDSKA